MNVGIRKETQMVNSEIIDDFFTNAQSVASIAKKYGRSTTIVNRIIASYRRQYLAEHGVPPTRAEKPKDPRVIAGKRPLSRHHHDIGLRLTRYVDEHRLSPSALGMQLSCSRVVARNMMGGFHDLTLTEIAKISEVINLPLDFLLTPPKETPIYAVG